MFSRHFKFIDRTQNLSYFNLSGSFLMRVDLLGMFVTGVVGGVTNAGDSGV